MCGHLVDAGYPTTVFNRTASKTAPLVEKGAVAASSPAEVAAASGAWVYARVRVCACVMVMVVHVMRAWWAGVTVRGCERGVCGVH